MKIISKNSLDYIKLKLREICDNDKHEVWKWNYYQKQIYKELGKDVELSSISSYGNYQKINFFYKKINHEYVYKINHL